MEPQLDEDISPFRRIVQEIINLRRNSSNLGPPGIETIGDVLSKFNLLDRLFESARDHYHLTRMNKRQAKQSFNQLTMDRLHKEKVAFKDTARRLLALSRRSFSESVAVTSFTENPSQLESVSQSLKLRLGLHSYSTISHTILSVYHTLNAIISLFPPVGK
jgi:hypothetical protein